MQPSIICLGSPMIDVSVNINQDFLTDNNLRADFAYDANEMHALGLDNIDAKGSPTTIGGSVTNTARIIKWIGRSFIDVTYLGAIGNDEYGRYIRDELTHEGIETIFAVKTNEKTARCTVLLHNDKRTLCTDLGASKNYDLQDLQQVVHQHGKLRTAADGFVYFSSFFLRVSKECVEYLLSLETKEIIFNLGAEFVLQEYAEIVVKIVQKAKLLIGNLQETLCLCKLFNCINEKSNIEETLINFYTTWMGAEEENKLLIITNGENPAMLLTKTSLKKFKVRATNVKDANGAGDAFAGGFIAKYLERLHALHNPQKVRRAITTRIPTTSTIIDDRKCERNQLQQISKHIPIENEKEKQTQPQEEEDDDGVVDDNDEEVDLDECMKCALWAASEIVQNTGCNFDRNKSFT